MRFLTYIKRLGNIGHLIDDPNSFESGRIILLNKITIIGMAICSTIVLIHVLLGNWLQASVVSGSIFLVFLPTLYFQSIHRHGVARFWFLTGIFALISTIFFHSIELELKTGTEYLPVLLIPLVVIFLDRLKATISTAFIILCGNFFINHRYVLSNEVNEKIFFGLHINWITVSLTILFCVVFFKKSLLQANRLIENDKEELSKANKTKNLLFAIISHDIRSPLSSLKQYLSLDPSMRNNPEEFMQFQEVLNKKVGEVNQTLDDLLFWSKSQLQGIVVKPSAFLVSSVLENVMLISEEVIRKKGIELSINHHTDEKVWCDKDHLTVAIRNLIQNAIKFTSKDEKISISSSRENDMIQITIADTGKGMDDTTLTNLRKGMIVESHLGTAGEVGTGLGLSLVRDMITKNHGEMRVQSELGVGTEISLLIPVAK